MLPAPARLCHRREFAETLRRGQRAGRPALVLSLLRQPANSAAVDGDGSRCIDIVPARVGFVVGRRTGGAVVRNRLRRRLRHLLAERYGELPAGSYTVLRALPGAEALSYPELAAEISRLLRRVLR